MCRQHVITGPALILTAGDMALGKIDIVEPLRANWGVLRLGSGNYDAWLARNKLYYNIQHKIQRDVEIN